MIHIASEITEAMSRRGGERVCTITVNAMKKSELLATARSLEELARLLDAGADAFHIGDNRYGLRLPGDFGPDDIRQALKLARPRGAKIYVAVNNIMTNDKLAELPQYLRELHDIGVDAIVFGDPSVLIAMRQAGVQLPLHWSAEMISTNYATANYWASKGATRVFAARELNLDEVLEMKKHLAMEVQVQVHGMTNIYHSKRTLVRSYMEHQGKDAECEDLRPERGLVLVEAERQEEKFPVYEDVNGTHIMSSDDICMLESLHELMEGGIDSFRIEGLLKPVEYHETVVRSYRKAIDAYFADPENYAFNEAWLDDIRRLQDPDRELSFGFYYKEQVY